MHQTLLSLAGLLMITLLSFAQQQAARRAQRQAVQEEVRQMAVGIAKQSVEVIRARAFDNESVSGTPPVGQLTDPSNFPSGKDCEAFGGGDRCDAVEDFHEMTPARQEGQVPGGTFAFRMEVDVHYVDADMNRTTSKTERKEVTIRVQDIRGPNSSQRLSQPVVLTEVIGYHGAS